MAILLKQIYANCCYGLFFGWGEEGLYHLWFLFCFLWEHSEYQSSQDCLGFPIGLCFLPSQPHFIFMSLIFYPICVTKLWTLKKSQVLNNDIKIPVLYKFSAMMWKLKYCAFLALIIAKIG